MGTFRIDVEIENPAVHGARRRVSQLLVDTGSELTWVPAAELEALGVAPEEQRRFRQASGAVVERWVGSVVIRAANTFASENVVFGQPGDLSILGSRTLEGLNLMVDPVSKLLVDAGPAPAAAA